MNRDPNMLTRPLPTTTSPIAPLPALTRVGVVGLGLMGMACAGRLHAARFDLHGYDVDAGKRSAFAGVRRTPAVSLADLAITCDAILLSVFDTTQVEQVIEAADGLLPAARGAGRAPLLLCTSTCDPDRIAALAARCAAVGLPFIEMPISGTSVSMIKGDAVGLVAGDESAIARAAPVLDALCAQRHYLGACGNGGRAKLAVNLVLGLNRGAMAEGLVFAQRLGLASEPFLNVLIGSAAYSRVMEVKGAMMAARRFEPPQSRVDQSLKDFNLIIEQAGTHGQSLPFAETYTALLQGCVDAGEASIDNAAIIEEISRRAVR
jgi:putative dehydrogenase